MRNPLEDRFQKSWVHHLARLREVEREVASQTNGEDRTLRYSVPRIVCVGEESSGKSSTLERVAMMKVFPSDEKLCTRVPIELRLRYRDPESLEERFRESGYVVMRMAPGLRSTVPEDESPPMSPDHVPNQIRQWMEDLVRAANGTLTGVSDDKIIVELYSSRRVNLDLIDLPGIVAGSMPGEPADMMERTRQLSSSFMDDAANPHTFVIAVVSAMDARIRNSQAMELVQRHNKVQFTIGALTKADRSADTRRENPYSKLLERLNGVAEDAPELALGYVALKNRDTVIDTDISLTQVNAEEKEWFQRHLPEHVKSCGIDSLIDKLVDKVEEYTRGPWIEAETARIEDERTVVRNNLKIMGDFIPSNLDDLVRYYSAGVQEIREPSIVDVLNFVPTVYVGGPVLHPQSLSIIGWRLEEENWVHGDIEDLTPVFDTTSRKFAGINTFDINMFRGDTDARTAFAVLRWKCCAVTDEDLFQSVDYTAVRVGQGVSPTSAARMVKSDAVQKLSDVSQKPGSLVFVGKRLPFDKNKMQGFFLAADTLNNQTSFIWAMLQHLANETRCKRGFTTSFPDSSETVPSSSGPHPSHPSQPCMSTAPTFVFGSPNDNPSGRQKLRAKRPVGTIFSQTVVPNHDGVVVLVHGPKLKYEAETLGMTSELKQQYNARSKLREKLIHTFSEQADAVFSSVANSVVAKLTEFDARFDGFMDALTNILSTWCEERIAHATASFTEYLDNNRVIVDRVELNNAMKISAKHYFSNKLTATMREIIFFAYVDDNIVEAFAQGSLNEELRTYATTRDLSEEALIRESCAEERAILTSRLDALTTMKNALATVFSSEAHEAPAMPENTPSPEATPSGISHSLSRTSI